MYAKADDHLIFVTCTYTSLEFIILTLAFLAAWVSRYLASHTRLYSAFPCTYLLTRSWWWMAQLSPRLLPCFMDFTIPIVAVARFPFKFELLRSTVVHSQSHPCNARRVIRNTDCALQFPQPSFPPGVIWIKSQISLTSNTVQSQSSACIPHCSSLYRKSFNAAFTGSHK